jgi:hypothetical protein
MHSALTMGFKNDSNIQNYNLFGFLFGCDSWFLNFKGSMKVAIKIFGTKGSERTGEWRRLHNGGLCDLYCATNIIRAVKFRRMRWTSHVARRGK